ncbi:MAG: alpha/beta hydrolase [Anaerolineae bacterium]
MSKSIVVNLWPDNSSNNPPGGPRPYMEIYPPTKPLADPAPAVIVLPGGGYEVLAPHEAVPFGEFWAAHGYVGVVCYYRVAPNRFPAPMADAARAVRLVRTRAAEFGVDPHKVAIMGFSAGGHLACTTATQPDLWHDPQDDLVGKISARPDRAILAYPVISMRRGLCAKSLLGEPTREMKLQMSNELHVTADTPPIFIFHTADDAVVPVSHSLNYAAACRKAGVPVELHVYRTGHHGVGLASQMPDLKSWMGLALDWSKYLP